MRERSLDSAPTRVPSAPLDGSSTLHATRYLGVRDSDGSRKLLEIDTTGAPAATAPWRLPTAPFQAPPAPESLGFVPSHPSTHQMDTARHMSASAASIDPASVRLPRQPWPKEADISVKYPRSSTDVTRMLRS